MSGLVLVTGANGFVGRHLVRDLLQAGYQVRAVDRSFTNALETGAERITADILDTPLIRAAMEGVNTVYHLAALTSLWLPDETHFENVNATGTRLVLKAAIEAGAERFVYCSSFTTMISGPRKGEARIVLDDDVSDLDALFGAYARSKRLAEQIVLDAHYRIDPVIVLPSAPIGQGDYNLTAPTCLLRDLINGTIPATLDQIINFIDVTTLATAIRHAGEQGEPANRYLLVGENLKMADFLKLVEEITGLAMPKHQVPYPIAYLAAFIEEKIICRLTKRPPKAPFSGVRMAGRKLLFDSSKAQFKFKMDLNPLDDALLEAILWLSKNGHITRTMPALEVETLDAEQ